MSDQIYKVCIKTITNYRFIQLSLANRHIYKIHYDYYSIIALIVPAQQYSVI